VQSFFADRVKNGTDRISQTSVKNAAASWQVQRSLSLHAIAQWWRIRHNPVWTATKCNQFLFELFST